MQGLPLLLAEVKEEEIDSANRKQADHCEDARDAENEVPRIKLPPPPLMDVWAAVGGEVREKLFSALSLAPGEGPSPLK